MIRSSGVCGDCIGNPYKFTFPLHWTKIFAAISLSFTLFVCFPAVTSHCGCIFHSPQWALASSFSKFLDHTQRRATVSRTPLDEWSIRRRGLYLTTHNTHNRKTSIGTHKLSGRAAVGRTTTGTGCHLH
jgi:hypothetical protein